MIGRLSVILLASFTAITANARNDWYAHPVVLDAGETVIGHVPDPVSEATVHVRASVNAAKGGDWGIIWGRTDTCDYYRAMVSFEPLDRTEYYFAPLPQLTVEHIHDGQTETLFSDRIKSVFDNDGAYNSLKLQFDGAVAYLYGGYRVQQELCKVPFDSAAGDVSVLCSQPLSCQRIQVESVQSPVIPVSDFGSVEALIDRLRASDDQSEGIWEYMDRDTKPEKAQPGGIYTLATVKNGDHYDIVYIKGADINRDSWRPMMLKGVLTPTIFTGNYDMRWYTAQGMLISDDANAQLSDDGAVLTLRFPVLSAQLRFRRLKP